MKLLATKRSRVTAMAIGFVVTICVLWSVLTPSEPRYEGKTVSYWLKHPGTNQAQMASVAGMTTLVDVVAFPKFDSNALPYITRELERNDGRMKRFYVDAWDHSPKWIQRLAPKPVPPLIRKYNALLALEQVGPEGKSAIPTLQNVIKHDATLAPLAIQILGGMGTENDDVRAALTELMGSTNTIISKYADMTLHRVKSEAPVRIMVH